MKRFLIVLIVAITSVLLIDYTTGWGTSNGNSTVIKKEDPTPTPPKEEILPATLHFMPDFDIYTSEGWNVISQNNSERGLAYNFDESNVTFYRLDTDRRTKTYRLSAPIWIDNNSDAVGLSMEYLVSMVDSEESEHGVYLRLYNSQNGVYITSKIRYYDQKFEYNFRTATIAQLDSDWTLNYGNSNYPLGTALAQYGKNLGLSINDIFTYFSDVQVIVKSTYNTLITINNLSINYE